MASPAFDFASWPPALTDAQRQHLTVLATTHALAHGLLYLPVPTPAADASDASDADTAAPPTSAIHAPLSLLPSPFPRALFAHAQRLQRLYNVLYARIARDTAFLDAVMGAEAPAGAGTVDAFTGALWRIWKALRDEHARSGVAQPLHLGIFRSDYLLHAPADDGDDSGTISLKQVEFNTISASFGALSERASRLHNYLLSATGYFGVSPHLTKANLPPNNTTAIVAGGLAAAHRAYGVDAAYILFVVQPGERNVFDQRWLEYELLERHSIHVIRQTFDELATSASLSPDGARTLHITTAATLSSASDTHPVEVSVVYFRAGYTPTDYTTPQHFATRALLARARAINCPTLALQLAGGKKVQQVLTRPGVLERFLQPQPGAGADVGAETFSDADLAAVRASWVEMWGLDDDGADGADGNDGVDGVQRAHARAPKLVLKPQREGGGNNVYKGAIPAFLAALPAAERAAWIAMQLIEPPAGVGNYLVRAGSGSGAGARAQKADVVSELGVFGWALFGGEGMDGGRSVLEEESGGWLLRTKGRESDEGGVAVGFSVLDSVVLVD